MRWENVCWYLADRLSIWVPPVFAVWTVILVSGFMGTICHRLYLQEGGTGSFFDWLFPVLTTLLVILFLLCILPIITENDDRPLGVFLGAVIFGMLVAVVSPLITLGVLWLLSPDTLQLPALQAIVNGQLAVDPYSLFGSVRFTGVVYVLIAAPYFAYGLLALVWHLVISGWQLLCERLHSSRPAVA